MFKNKERKKKGPMEWAMEVLRIYDVKQYDIYDKNRGVESQDGGSSSTYVRAGSSSSSSSSQSTSNNYWNGDTATISLSIKNTVDVESSLTNIAVHNVSLHSIDSTSIKSSNLPISATSRLFAYGGAAGLLRIHTLDIFKEIVTDNL
jgi:hypothetical protein